ncbi:MAG: hypothetical protein NWE86_06360 [Candidatus Bathyarchaeota archaeon]|nr:hypothetical protein [Candidatus Bathyarchaeota archaeon]
MNPVIILDGDRGDITSLGLGWLFARRGIDVYLAMEQNNKFNTAKFSSYFKKVYNIPGIGYNREVVKRFLKNFCLSNRAVVYPFTDSNTLILSEIKDELPDNYYYVVGDKEAVETLVKKDKFYQTLQHSRINYPLTYFPKDQDSIQQIGAMVSYPVFVKPSISQLFLKILSEKKTSEESYFRKKFNHGFVAYSKKELTKYYQFSTRHGMKVMVQELIPGPPSSSYQLEGYYNSYYDPDIIFARQRLRIEPLDFGDAVLSISIPIKKLTEEKKVINEFIKSIGYKGLMSAEFKKDPRDGKMKILEINTRPWLNCWLSSVCRSDIIFYSYLDAIGEKTKNIEEYEIGVKSIILPSDLLASAKMLKAGNLSFQDWIRSYLGKKCVNYFSRDGLISFIMLCIVEALKILKNKLKR